MSESEADRWAWLLVLSFVFGCNVLRILLPSLSSFVSSSWGVADSGAPGLARCVLQGFYLQRLLASNRSPGSNQLRLLHPGGWGLPEPRLLAAGRLRRDALVTHFHAAAPGMHHYRCPVPERQRALPLPHTLLA